MEFTVECNFIQTKTLLMQKLHGMITEKNPTCDVNMSQQSRSNLYTYTISLIFFFTAALIPNTSKSKEKT